MAAVAPHLSGTALPAAEPTEPAEPADTGAVPPAVPIGIGVGLLGLGALAGAGGALSGGPAVQRKPSVAEEWGPRVIAGLGVVASGVAKATGTAIVIGSATVPWWAPAAVGVGLMALSELRLWWRSRPAPATAATPPPPAPAPAAPATPRSGFGNWVRRKVEGAVDAVRNTFQGFFDSKQSARQLDGTDFELPNVPREQSKVDLRDELGGPGGPIERPAPPAAGGSR